MTDWTEAAVREALACVDAEWSVGPGMAGVTATAGRVHVDIAPHAVRAAWAAAEPAFVPEIEVAMRRSSTEDDVRVCVLALRTIVIATFGPEVWPWATRDTERDDQKVHFGVRPGHGGWTTGCFGTAVRFTGVSTDPAKTTCKACLRSKAWKAASKP